jgi:hypothetical protein
VHISFGILDSSYSSKGRGPAVCVGWRDNFTKFRELQRVNATGGQVQPAVSRAERSGNNFTFACTVSLSLIARLMPIFLTYLNALLVWKGVELKYLTLL